MPQMAPLMWMNLFIYFFLIFIFFNILNFYNFKYSLPLSNNNNKLNKNFKKMLTINWKW